MDRMGIVITTVRVKMENRWLSDKWLSRSKKELDAKPYRKS